jgi:riboflavin synthase
VFTGIVEEIGTVRRISGKSLAVAARKVIQNVALGDSIAVNGVCLTVVEHSADGFAVGVMPETLRRTNLGLLRPGDRVNLERALSPSSRLGGHFVQGHVDGTGRIISSRPEAEALLVRIEAPPELMRYIVEKGFVAVDGVSLTAFATDGRGFSVSLVSFTQQNVTLPQRRPGDQVNLEVDILGKYVERFVRGAAQPSGGVTEQLLAENGFM